MGKLNRHKRIFVYSQKSIRYTFVSNLTDDQRPDVVIFLGAGEISLITQMVAKRAGAGVVVVDGLPHWHADYETTAIEDFTKRYLANAYVEVLATFAKKSMHVLAESQAALAATALAGTTKDMGNLGLICPVGFSAQAFGDTKTARLRSFRKRILKTSLQYRQSVLYDPRNFIVGLIILRAMLREPSLTSLAEKYAAGISYDSLEDLRRASSARYHAGSGVYLILGQNDKLFPPTEITFAIDSANIPHVTITIVPSATHSSLATRAGREELSAALRAVRNTGAIES
jgi:pimeloyl-ACP methyl ester carboxylesterase